MRVQIGCVLATGLWSTPRNTAAAQVSTHTHACCTSLLQVLTTGFWPTYKSIELALPQEMVAGVELFKEFYEVENKHRCARQRVPRAEHVPEKVCS